MNTLNTIIEEEKERARKQFDDSPVSLRIDALERFAHVHGWSQFEGRTIQDEIDTIVTTAMQRAYEAGQREERANVQESFVAFCDAFIENGDNSIDLESLEEWRQHTLTPDKTTEV